MIPPQVSIVAVLRSKPFVEESMQTMRLRFALNVLLATFAMGAPAFAQEGKQTVADSVTIIYVLPELEVLSTVSGTGKTRAANTLDSTYIARIVPSGTSALRSIERLPGVNIQSVDAFGAYEWSTRVTIRGFQTQQIGQTFDGVPLGDMTYGNFNGLNIARAVDSSNLRQVTVEQGSGALGTASANNLGGVIQYRSNDPRDEYGVRLHQLFGEKNSLRTYLRLDAGRHSLGEDAAVRGYMSISNTSNDKWKGAGHRVSTFPGNDPLLFGQSGLFREADNWHDQLNAKVDFILGDLSSVTAFYNYSDKKESDYMDLSLGVFESDDFGPGTDYWTDWATAKQYAAYALPPYNPLGDVAYYMSAQGARQDHLAYVRSDLHLGIGRLILTPYMHSNRGAGDWHALSYGASYSPDPIMFRQSQYHLDRMGVSGVFATHLAGNEIEAGFWWEANEVTIRRPRWRLINYAEGPEVDFDNVLRLDFDRTGEIGTRMAYIQNTNRLLDDRLRVTYGLKFLRVDGDFRSNGNTPTGGVTAPLFADANRPALSLATKGGILPQAGAVLALSANDEVFGNFSENVNQFPYSPQTGVYNAAVSLFDFLQNAKPEKARSYDLGLRTRRDGIEGSLAAYFIDYRNRLLGISLCPPTVTCATGLGNVGSVTTKGVEGLLSVALAPGLTWLNSASYNISTFDDDYLANQSNPNTVVRTAGKDVQDAPRLLAMSSLTFERAGLNANVSGRFVDKRYFTYTNDLEAAGDGAGHVSSYALIDLGIGYTFNGAGILENAFIQLNMRNVLDEVYLATMGSNGYTAMGDNQTLLTGPGRLLYVSTGFNF